MNTLHIKDLTLTGKHGTLKEEKENVQPFNLEIDISYDFEKSFRTDDLADTIDYITIERIAKEIIEGPHHNLIETLASDIADRSLAETQASAITITVEKPRAPTIGTPSITIEKVKVLEQKGSIVSLLDFTKEKIDTFYSPDSDGILHVKGVLYDILDRVKIKDWSDTKWISFEKKEEKYIQNNQEVSVVLNGVFGEMTTSKSPQENALHNLYYRIRNEIAKYSTIPLAKGDRLETKLIKYPVSTLGVGAHKDLSSNINAIVLFNLYGTTTFYTADDKQRTNEKAYLVEPGDIVIMRGPRNKEESAIRPYHYVLDIAEERLVFVCREIEAKKEAVINKDNWMGF